ncbi:hypothetical protein [Pseudonocardia spinosispora]|uniref:hypothetical protein n=1 Tax=Pseudonocardia spinosispora TaxID=103441 RepID=UPI00041286A3|nr:hypothetical protein [Pseudonocardia spinosispora]
MDERPWLGRLARSGELVEGCPCLDVGHPALVGLLGSDPPMLFDESNAALRWVRDDLTISADRPMRRHTLRAYGRAGRMWVSVHSPPSQDIAIHGVDACWPLPGPPVYPEDRQYWLLTELSPVTLDPIVSAMVQAVPARSPSTTRARRGSTPTGCATSPPTTGQPRNYST